MMYKSRIAHGMLTAGLICPVLNRLCGDGSVTYSQEIKFKSAVLLNDTVTVRGEVVELIPEENKVKIDVGVPQAGHRPGGPAADPGRLCTETGDNVAGRLGSEGKEKEFS